ncbi:hypothetical protein PN497_20115 [Sphaerospermopsis kisseleviana CS-549]|uniref:Uncharacterized protein n=1 Tax=Sphaerospermopsis kisseleviana CS-549 TaxID=3021783 RepID=A0ABT4ZW51_9CYAN|nr:hypothetical protein [Sphaerospermopsis kisseleviana]MDB9443638.1 hypothetical protein [Sphaerospermopsis kisseleviana CS-549]BAZ81068.1 hypothetical protein NIES73_23340 [Sphaerospermopsis kisseleviana NIES-73]
METDYFDIKIEFPELQLEPDPELAELQQHLKQSFYNILLHKNRVLKSKLSPHKKPKKQ